MIAARKRETGDRTWPRMRRGIDCRARRSRRPRSMTGRCARSASCMAIQAAALGDGFLGRFHRIRDRAARALPLWPKEMPGYGSLLAFHAFGAEEAGDYARAEDESREAVELEPLSFWPHHTVAHVMEMTGRPEDGLGWMSAREALW